MMVNGLTDLKMAEEYTSNLVLELIIVDNGRMEKEMVMVFWSFQTINFTKEHFQNQSNMDMEYKNLRMVIIIKVNIKRENSMEKENIVGLMDHPTKEILYKDIDMGKEIGNLQGKVVIYIREDIKTIKNVVMVAMCGQMVVFIKDTLKTILSNFIII